MKHHHAVEYIRTMRGGSQAQLIRASDGRLYVVKFPNNPQGSRILANELLGSLLAKLLGLPVPDVAVIDVCEDLIRHSQEMVIKWQHGWSPCQAGLCFGSLFAEPSYDCAPGVFPMERIENPTDLLGMLVFDKWTSNSDRRQLIAYKPESAQIYRLAMIDQGDCFCRDKWTFLDKPVIGLCDYRKLYQRVKGVDDFEPWLNRLENDIIPGILYDIAETIPPQWYLNNWEALNRLVIQVDHRRILVRQLLRLMIQSRRDVFPDAFSEGAVSAYGAF